MIHDKLTNWQIYFKNEPWRCVFEFLSGLTAETEDCARISLMGDDIYAAVMTYQTCSPAELVLETHDEYIDIQMSIINSEAIDWFSRQGLEVRVPYDRELDLTFYHRPEPPPARVNNYPGYFTLLYADDAHMPRLMTTDGPVLVKKVVVKVRRTLVT